MICIYNACKDTKNFPQSRHFPVKNIIKSSQGDSPSVRRGHPYLSLTVAINVDKTIFHEPYCTSVVGIPHLSLLKHGFVVTTEIETGWCGARHGKGTDKQSNHNNHAYSIEDMERNIRQTVYSAYLIERGLARRVPTISRWKGMHMANANNMVLRVYHRGQ